MTPSAATLFLTDAANFGYQVVVAVVKGLSAEFSPELHIAFTI